MGTWLILIFISMGILMIMFFRGFIKVIKGVQDDKKSDFKDLENIEKTMDNLSKIDE
jgi:hypothetical protein